MLCCFRPASDGNSERSDSSVHPLQNHPKSSLEKKIPMIAGKTFSMHAQLKSSFEREGGIALTHQHCQSSHPAAKEKCRRRSSHRKNHSQHQLVPVFLEAREVKKLVKKRDSSSNPHCGIVEAWQKQYAEKCNPCDSLKEKVSVLNCQQAALTLASPPDHQLSAVFPDDTLPWMRENIECLEPWPSNEQELIQEYLMPLPNQLEDN